MNIVFLDIDGVLNSELYFEKLHKARTEAEHTDVWGEYPYSEMDERAVEMLNSLAKDCKFVISSCWRGMINPTCEEVLRSKGFVGEIIGQTEHLPDWTVRGNEVSKWIGDKRGELKLPYPLESYVIIDDDNDFLMEQQPHLFQTDAYCGLTPYTLDSIQKFFRIGHYAR